MPHRTESDLVIRRSEASDAPLVRSFMEERWGGEPLVINCKFYHPSTLPGFLVFHKDELIGCLIYELQEAEREIIVFEIVDRHQGIGSRLLRQFIVEAAKEGCRRVHLMTTNDNLDALRFYQRRGFTLCGIRLGASAAAREIKPSLIETGDYGIPVRDEILLEMILQEGDVDNGAAACLC